MTQMVNLSPTEESYFESYCSLKFAAQVNQCELGKPKRQIKEITECASASTCETDNDSDVQNEVADLAPASTPAHSTSQNFSVNSVSTKSASRTAGTPSKSSSSSGSLAGAAKKARTVGTIVSSSASRLHR